MTNFSVSYKFFISQLTRVPRNIFFLFILALSISPTTVAQSAREKREITQSTNINQLQKLRVTFEKRQLKYKEEAERVAKIKGWKLKKIGERGNYMELMRISPEGNPIYFSTDNLGGSRTSRTNKLWTGGSQGLNLNGENITLGIWDAGSVDPQHQEWQNNIISLDGSDPHDHSTHVGGTMVAQGIVPEAKGAASKATLHTYDWNDETVEMINEAADGLLLSNHSYGWFGGNLKVQEFGKYDDWAQSWDEIMFNAPYFLAVKSAGNDQQSGYNPTKYGYDILSGADLSKNALVVAAVEVVDNYFGPGSVLMSDFSSWGPSDDGRIKPEISTKGVAVYSTLSGGKSVYATYDGTSMASPNVTGSLGLLQQHYHNTFSKYMKSATIKALVLATADEAGEFPGPDYKYGWGLLNVEVAALAISGEGKNTIINELNLNNQNRYTTSINSDGVQPLTIVIAWTDQAGTPIQTVEIDDRKAMLVNDLDIRISKDGETFMPWKLDPSHPSNAATKGDNVVDNIELITIHNVTEGAYTVTVTHKGTLAGGSQNFSMIVLGGSTGEIVCETPIPAILKINDIDDFNAVFSWNRIALTQSYNYRYRKIGTSTWTSGNSGINSVRLLNLSPFTNYETQVRSSCVGNSSSYSSILTFQTLNLCVGTTPGDISVTPTVNDGPYIYFGPFGYNPYQDELNSLVSWTPIEAVSNYNLRYRESGTSDWSYNNISGKNSSYEIIGLAFDTDYELQINSVCNNGNISEYSKIFSFKTESACIDNPIQSFRTTSISETEVTLEWDAPHDRVYSIYYFTGFSYSDTSIKSSTGSVTLTDLTPGSLYEVIISHTCSAQNLQAKLKFTTKGFQPCSLVKMGGVVASDITKTEATISWDPIPNVVKYNYKYKEGGEWITGFATDNFIVLTNLTSIFYIVEVNAECDDGEETPYVTVIFQTTDPCTVQGPQNVHTTNIANNSAIIGWDEIDGGWSYDVKYKKESSSTYIFETVYSNTITLNGLTQNTNYEVGIYSKCLLGNSPLTQFNFTTTGAVTCTVVPSGLTASNLSSSGVNISWGAVSGVTSYDYRYRLFGDEWVTHSSSNASIELSGLNSVTNYDFQVRAKCTDGTSTYSNTLNFTTSACHVTTPTGLSASAVTTSAASVSWGVVSQATIYNYRYRVSGGTWIASSSNATNVQLNGLTSGITYQIQVNSECTDETSAYSEIVNFTTGACSVSIPTGLSISEVTGYKATVSWNAVSQATSYNYRYREVGEDWIAFTINGISDNIVLLTPSSNYEVQVKSKCDQAASSYSSSVFFTTDVQGPTSCNLPPEDFRTTSIGTTTVSISWFPVWNNYAYISTMYQVKYRPTTRAWYSYKLISKNEITLIGLTAGTDYEVRLKAYCDGGPSPFSDLTFTTKAATSANSVSTTKTSSRFSNNYIVYPNPNNGNFTIDFKENEAIVKSITIYDMFGLKVFQKEYNRKLNTEEYSLGLVKSGLYKVAIRSEHSIQYETLLIEL